jgi:hypothetical protein
MATDLLLYAQFKASKVGKTGLSPTIDIWKITKADSTVTSVVTGGATFAIGRGLYGYRIAAATPLTHDYIGVLITADATVDDQEIPALRFDYGESRATEFALIDVATSTRLAAASYVAPPTPPTVGAIADAVWDEASAGHVATGSTGKLLTTAGAATDPLLNIAGSYASDTMGGKIQLIGTNTTVVNSPIVNADISVIYGDDYYIADGRAVPLTSTQWVIADITPYTGVVKVTTPTAVLSFPVTISAAQQAYLPLTAVQIATIGVGYHTYDFEVTKIADSHVATLQQGSFAVTPDAR